MPSFDASHYTFVPTRSAAATVGLARALVAAAPSQLPGAQALRLVQLRERGEALQHAWVEAGRPEHVPDVRDLDDVLDRRWAALRGRIEACVLLSDDDLAPRAAVLLRTLFPKGLDFLDRPYTEEWAQSERRLALIKAHALEAELAALCGEPFVARLREAHAAYGEGLGITKPKVSSAEARVFAPLEALKEAIARYVREVLGTMNEYDPDEVAAAQDQLAPLVRARREVLLGGEATDEPAEPIETPLPQLPAGVVAAAEMAAASA